MVSPFPNMESIVHYLREPSLSTSIINSTKTSFEKTKDVSNSSKRQQQKAEDQRRIIDTDSSTYIPEESLLQGDTQILPEGRVRYGPITVHPRKQPSKTLYTGRRSKYECLSADEEEKRRDRRERNRVAATKCREKRENVLNNLENEHIKELNENQCLLNLVDDLEKQKNHLESLLTNHLNECPLMNNITSSIQSSMIFGDAAFLSLINDGAPPPPLPSLQLTLVSGGDDDDEFNRFLEPESILTNSDYNTDDSNSILISQQEQKQQQTIIMTSSSIERLINSLQSPILSMESSNNHSILVNSAIGSSCAKQHSNSSEDDSFSSARPNHYVC